MVEQNLVFDNTDRTHLDDHAVIPSDALAEGERDKIIQNSTLDTSLGKLTDENQNRLHQLICEPITHKSTPDSTNSSQPHIPEGDPDVMPNTSRDHRPRHPPGHYAWMNKGLDANIATITGSTKIFDGSQTNGEDLYEPSDLPMDYTLATGIASKPWTLDKALRGPNVLQWQEALEYEISQLEKLGTWVIEDLPVGQTAIPYQEVLK